MMRFTILLAFGLLATTTNAAVVSLNPDNFLSETSGKTVFIKFFAPWCGHCKAMAPDWERLAEDWKDSPVGLIAEVDCADEQNEEVCAEFQIAGFPSLKYGDVSSLEDYQGPRTYDELAAFAKEHLKPMCSPSHMNECTPEEKEQLEKIMSMSLGDIQAKIEDIQRSIEEVESNFEQRLGELQEQYEEMVAESDEKKRTLKEEGNLKQLKSVAASKGGDSPSEDTPKDEF